jgi:hypothetical protein
MKTDNSANDDPLYDPLMDERDEAWMQQQSRKRNPPIPVTAVTNTNGTDRNRDTRGGRSRGGRGRGARGARGGRGRDRRGGKVNTASDYDAELDTSNLPGHQSDAVLSCPACFATLCDDCQQ